MKRKEIDTENSNTHWFIDLDWYKKSSRSFITLAQMHLCPKCAMKSHTPGNNISENKIFSNIKDCCSHAPGFINDKQPIAESAFCLFLANGNQSLNLEELSNQLSEWRGGDYRTSIEILPRLLKSDQYYGLRESNNPSAHPNT